MVFWGAEVKPGEPFTHSGEDDGEYEGSRLHLSQATLGLDGKGKERTVVKCKVGDGPELLLCSFTPGVSESCSLDLLFDQDVVFSVAGSTSVHLVGYYMPLDDEGDDYETEESDESDWEDNVDDEDYDEVDDRDTLATSVTITEVDENESEILRIENRQTTSETVAAQCKATKKRKTVETMDKKNSALKEVEREEVKEKSEDEDEDGFPLVSDKSQAENGKEKKKKNKKKKKKKGNDPIEVEGTGKAPGKSANENGTQGKALTTIPAESVKVASPRDPANGKIGKKASPSIRKFPNGLEIEEITMGKPDARQTKPGKRVSVSYTGKLKSSGKVFDSTVGKKPFSFRLGVGEVIKGWDVAIAGMRIGDKRRITVPPAMGYGAKGASPIPGNSWLVFDVEVVDVAR